LRGEKTTLMRWRSNAFNFKNLNQGKKKNKKPLQVSPKRLSKARRTGVKPGPDQNT
jgi:hypothetical protein